MQTTANIRFDETLYSRTAHSVILLYHMNGTHIAIPLPNAHLMSFIQVFNDTRECLNYIITTDKPNITLFVYEDNMRWLIMNSYFENISQLCRIYIFCSSSPEQNYWTTWTQRFRAKIEEPFLYNDLDFRLLCFGSNHIPNVRQHFENDNSVLNRLNEDERTICRSLAKYYLQRANAQNDRIRQSEEARS